MVQAENLLATVRPLLATLWQHFKSVACLKATLAFQKKTSFRPATESLIDKLTVMNCSAPTPDITTDNIFTTENFTTENFKPSVPDTSIADESLVESFVESSDFKSPSNTCDMQYVVDKCVRKIKFENKIGRIKSANNSCNGSEMDSDVYIESYKDQAKANQTDCLGDDELSDSEKRTKRTTKSLKSSRFKKRYSKKIVNI